ASTRRRVPRRASAAVRSGASAKRTSNRPECGRLDAMRRAPSGAPGRRVTSTAPSANRASGESVCTSTTTSPCRPWARTTTPARRSPLPVGVDDIDPHTTAADAADDRAQRRGRATAPADHLAEVFGVHPDLEGATAAGGDEVDPHLVGVVDDAPDEVLQRVGQDGAHNASAGRVRPNLTTRRALRRLLRRPPPSGGGRPSSAAWWPRWSAPRPRRPGPR